MVSVRHMIKGRVNVPHHFPVDVFSVCPDFWNAEGAYHVFIFPKTTAVVFGQFSRGHINSDHHSRVNKLTTSANVT